MINRVEIMRNVQDTDENAPGYVSPNELDRLIAEAQARRVEDARNDARRCEATRGTRLHTRNCAHCDGDF
jgi:hypothetical protein